MGTELTWVEGEQDERWTRLVKKCDTLEAENVELKKSVRYHIQQRAIHMAENASLSELVRDARAYFEVMRSRGVVEVIASWPSDWLQRAEKAVTP